VLLLPSFLARSFAPLVPSLFLFYPSVVVSIRQRVCSPSTRCVVREKKGKERGENQACGERRETRIVEEQAKEKVAPRFFRHLHFPISSFFSFFSVFISPFLLTAFESAELFDFLVALLSSPNPSSFTISIIILSFLLSLAHFGFHLRRWIRGFSV